MDEKILFESKWVKLKETPRGFQYLERKGKNSIAIFLIRKINDGIEVLVRFQPLCLENKDQDLFPCPITGSIELGENIVDTVKREVKEEAGYSVTDIHFLGNRIVGTQTNEMVYLFYCDVTNISQGEAVQDGSIHESISQNVWKPLDFLKECKYSDCIIAYYKFKELFNI